MLNDYYTKLSITLESSGGMCLDEPKAVTTTISTEMSECSVHAWFQLFEQVLAMAGFQEVVIMQGGAQLAFNEARDVDAMRKVAEIYDLKLKEDLAFISDGSGSELVA